jgi:hypothetical protein
MRRNKMVSVLLSPVLGERERERGRGRGRGRERLSTWLHMAAAELCTGMENKNIPDLLTLALKLVKVDQLV